MADFASVVHRFGFGFPKKGKPNRCQPLIHWIHLRKKIKSVCNFLSSKRIHRIPHEISKRGGVSLRGDKKLHKDYMQLFVPPRSIQCILPTQKVSEGQWTKSHIKTLCNFLSAQSIPWIPPEAVFKNDKKSHKNFMQLFVRSKYPTDTFKTGNPERSPSKKARLGNTAVRACIHRIPLGEKREKMQGTVFLGRRTKVRRQALREKGNTSSF
jgi:hypothetical protein